MRIASWNVNGLRACAKRGFLDWLDASGADLVGLQEVRAHEGHIPPRVRAPEGWFTHFAAAQRPGYSGVALYARSPLGAVETSLADESFDREGRLQLARLGALTVANVYFPNGSGRDRDNSRIPFKLEFYRALFARLERAKRRGARILVLGDFNTAHREIDLARPKQNRDTSGFTAVEREELERWMSAGWVDTFRRFEPGAGHYTWWSQRVGVRERNIGWRIDYVLASPAAMPFVRRAFIQTDVRGSDHCPVGVDVDDAIVEP